MRKTQNPNIVFLVLDTHRYDRLGIYGYDRGTSPNLDAFASQATVFEHAVSPGQWTIPAHASMFTGEFPSTHLTYQSSSALDPRFVTLAERLKSHGYQTSGFCNNPLVGVLNNGFTRGFDTFYNYGGAVPSVPEREGRRLIAPLQKLWSRYTQLLRKISYPIQNLVAQSDRVFNFILSPLLVPLWSRYAHFKGDTVSSLKDAVAHLRRTFKPGTPPQFLFINLMETHLPYSPPEEFARKYAPIIYENNEARDFMRKYNTQALYWLLPMEEDFTDLEYEALSGMYDAEVAYQDHLLKELLDELDRPELRENTMVIIVADHGEMLGEHRIMGHGLGLYQELIRVPLIIRSPGQQTGQRVAQTVSTTNLFYTALDAAHIDVIEKTYSNEIDVKNLSLIQLAAGKHFGPKCVYSEAYPPQHVIRIMQKRFPKLLASFRSDLTLRAVYKALQKLIHTAGYEDLLFDLAQDPREQDPLEDSAQVAELTEELVDFLERAHKRRPEHLAPAGIDIEDESLLQRLRGLGYLE
jgi:uncharacterized sulfatase